MIQFRKPKKNDTGLPSKPLKVLRIVKNVVFGVIMVAMLCVLIMTLTARINGGTPTLFGYTLYRVSSASMVPYLQVGDIILCKQCDPMTLKEGDVITYEGTTGTFAGKRVTHRVVKEPYLDEDDGQYYLLTKGDDNPIDDAPVSTSQVTGKMVDKIGWLKVLFDFFVTPWGLLTLIALIILAFFNEIINFAKALFGSADQEKKHEDVQDIIKRIQRESGEEE